MDILSLDATTAVRAIRDNRLDPLDLLEAHVEQIKAREPVVRAFASFDAEAARSALRKAPAGGRLYGIPFGVKDVLDTQDLPTEANSPIWKGHRPRMDAAAVALSRQAGAYVIGKTVTTEFAIRTPGATTNPHDATRTPGGSSSGSAAGIGANFFPVAFGTQTAGSTIRPAAFCGVVGYKPSFGLINRTGLRVMSDGLDTIATMGKSVSDCALLAGVASGRDLGDPEARPDRSFRIGLCRSYAWSEALPETVALMEEAARRLSAAGARVCDWEPPEAYEAMLEAHLRVQFYESAQSLSWEMINHPERVSALLRQALAEESARTPEEYDAMRTLMHGLRDGFSANMGDVDFLITPPAPGEAPVGLARTGGAAFNKFWTALHVPCVTVPVATGPNGMPLGLQIIARRGEDAFGLSAARWVQATLA